MSMRPKNSKSRNCLTRERVSKAIKLLEFARLLRPRFQTNIEIVKADFLPSVHGEYKNLILPLLSFRIDLAHFCAFFAKFLYFIFVAYGDKLGIASFEGNATSGELKTGKVIAEIFLTVYAYY